MSRYTLLEPREDLGRNVPVTSYEGLAIHHPNTNREAVRTGNAAAVDSHGQFVNGELESTRREGSHTLVKKDIIFQDPSGNANVSVPAPIEGYAHYLNPNTFGGVRIYDKPFGTPGAQLIGQVLHMDDRTFTKREGELIHYGEPLGIQSGTGPKGRHHYGTHAHVEVEPAQFQRYINDVLQGRIQNNGVVAPAQPGGATPSPDSGTLKDTLLTVREQGEGVKRLQEALNKAGIRDDAGQPLPTTGYFGDKTEAAVRKYQEQHGLKVDGQAGENTLKGLGIYPGQQQTTPQPNPQQPNPQQPPVQQPPPSQPQQPSQTPAQTNPYGFGPDNELGRLIGRGEGSYNSYNRGNAGDSSKPQNLTDLTVGEVMRRQELSKSDPNYLFAVGKYQFVDSTLKETVEKLGIDKNAKFTPQLQEKMFADYLIDEKRPAVHNYITGKTGGPQGLHSAQVALSMEFASVGDPDKGGRSHYDKVGNNSASITPKEVQTALDHMREQYQKNLQSGMTADQAYKALSGDPNKYTQNAGATGQTQAPGGGLDDKLLIKGEDGPGVKRLQEALNAAGIQVNGKPLPTTGHFGDMTEQAVRQYQEQKGLHPVDGKAGHDTLTALGIYPGQQQAPKAEAPHPQQATPPQQTAPQQTPNPQQPQQTAPQQTPNPQTPPSASSEKPPVDASQPQRSVDTDKPSIADPKHPDHRLYEQAMANLQQLGPSGGFKSQDELTKAAAAVAADAKASGLNSIDHVAKTNTPNGQTLLVAVEGNPTNPAAKNAYVDYAQATTQTVDQSSRMAEAARTREAQQQAQTQENRVAVSGR